MSTPIERAVNAGLQSSDAVRKLEAMQDRVATACVHLLLALNRLPVNHEAAAEIQRALDTLTEK
jgi:hypothetical protein